MQIRLFPSHAPLAAAEPTRAAAAVRPLDARARVRRWWVRGAGLAALAGGLLAATGCRTPLEARSAADEEAYAIVAAKQREALGAAPDFRIETTYSDRELAELAPEQVIAARQGTELYRLDLREALRLATLHSRDYQNRRETLYLSALSLSTERRKFETLYGFGGETSVERQSDGDQTVGASSDLTVDRALRGGGDLGFRLANDLLRYTHGDPRVSAASVLSFAFTQPLLRGAGREIASESLTQAERETVYAVREFARFQETFAVDVARQYYRLLQQKDTVRNEYNNYRNLVLARERAEALSVDRLPAFQVDQTRQDELGARNRYILAISQYETNLDSLKSLLGLPPSSGLRLDDAGLTDLTKDGLEPLLIPEDLAVHAALERRLDLLNEVDRFDDSKRKVVVAADALGTDVSVFTSASLGSSGSASLEKFNGDDYNFELGLRFDLPLDRLNERNTYRRRLIDLERQARSLGIAVDGVRDDVRGANRTLAQATKRYTIQRNAVSLAERRVESANLLLQAGRAETRDLLDAQSSLLSAQNALTQVIVDHHLARLSLLRDMGLLTVSEAGIGADPGLATLLAGSGVGPAAVDELDQPVMTPDELFGD